MEATVVKHTGSHYLLSALPDWNLFPAVLRGKIRLKGSSATNPIAVGDRVRYEIEDGAAAGGAAGVGSGNAGTLGVMPGAARAAGEGTGADMGAGTDRAAAVPTESNPAVITEVLPRKNYVIRRSTNLSRQSHIIAANVDMAYLIVTLDFPEVKLPFLDRLLVTCEVYDVPATIVLNKFDLFEDAYAEQVAAFHSIYENAGYKVLDVSAQTGHGIEELREACSGAVNLFSGVSGVGKSSLIRAIDPTLTPRVGEISDTHLQGKHTTTFYEMYRPASGGFIIDTPGIRGFGLVDIAREEIALYFPEMLEASVRCRFTPCTHTHEPGCAVKAAVEDGTISAERYSSYLGMLDESGKYR